MFLFPNSAICLHFQFQLFVYISNFSYLFTFQVVSVSCLFTNKVGKSAVYLLFPLLNHFPLIFFFFFRILVPFLQPGRLVSIKHGDKDFGFGSVVSFKKKTAKEKENPMEDCSYVIDVLIQVSEETSKSQSTLSLMPPAKNDKGVPIVVPIHPSLIQQISSVKLNMPRDI